MKPSPDLISTALQMLMALSIVLGGLLIVFYLMRRFFKRDLGGTKEPVIKILANQYIGVKKNIALVEVPGTVLVLGITNDRISLLTKIEDKSIVDHVRQKQNRMTPSFSDHLQRVTAKFKITNNAK